VFTRPARTKIRFSAFGAYRKSSFTVRGDFDIHEQSSFAPNRFPHRIYGIFPAFPYFPVDSFETSFGSIVARVFPVRFAGTPQSANRETPVGGCTTIRVHKYSRSVAAVLSSTRGRVPEVFESRSFPPVNIIYLTRK